jgi:hypothetical protein
MKNYTIIIKSGGQIDTTEEQFEKYLSVWSESTNQREVFEVESTNGEIHYVKLENVCRTEGVYI